MTKLAAGLVFLGLNFYTYYYLATGEIRPERATFEQFPAAIAEWICPRREHMTKDVELNLGVTVYLICTFERSSDGQVVNVYVGYHASQVRKEGGGSNETMIHPPAARLGPAGISSPRRRCSWICRVCPAPRRR